MNTTLIGAMKRIGYLALHKGVISNHMYVYVDFDERKLSPCIMY